MTRLRNSMKLEAPLASNESWTSQSNPVDSFVKHRVDIPGVKVEIRDFEWRTRDTVIVQPKSYWFSRTLRIHARDESARVRLPGSKRFTAYGSCWVTPPHTPVAIRRKPQRTRALLLRVEPDYFDEITGLDGNWYGESILFRFNGEGVVASQLLDTIAIELAAPEYASNRLINSLTTSFLIHFSRLAQRTQHGVKGGALSEWQLARIREMVANSPANELTVEKLGRACGISGRHLMRGFKTSVGTTVHDYIDQVRLKRAKLLLLSTDIQIRDIAAEVGFSNASHMASTFGRHCSMTPRSFRKRFQT